MINLASPYSHPKRAVRELLFREVCHEKTPAEAGVDGATRGWLALREVVVQFAVGFRHVDRIFGRPFLNLLLAPCGFAAFPGEEATAFLQENCFVCHDSIEHSGNLNLEALRFTPDDRDNFARWVKIVDRVSAGEMPPAGEARFRLSVAYRRRVLH